MRHYINTFRRYLGLFLLIWLILPLMVSLTIHPYGNYMGRASLWVEQSISTDNQKNLLSTGVESAAASQLGFLRELLNTEAYLKQVTDKVIETGFKLSSDEIQRLQIRISKEVVLSSPGSHLIEVTYQDIDPQLTTVITQAIVDNFVKLVTDRVRSQGALAISQFEAQLQQTKTELEQSNQKLDQYIAAHPGTVKATDVNSNNPLQPGDNIEYELLVQTGTNKRQRYEAMSIKLEQLQLSYGAFISGQGSIIRINDQPKIVDSFIFNTNIRILLGAGVGLIVASCLVLILVLLLCWTDSSYQEIEVLRRIPQVVSVAELPYQRRLLFKRIASKINIRKGSSRYYWQRWAWKVRGITLLGLLLMLGLGRLTASSPTIGLTVSLTATLVLLICRWPQMGYFMALAVVLPCELFINPDGISTYTTLPLTNLNFYTSLPLSATALEATLALTFGVTIIQLLWRNQSPFDRSPTTWAVVLLLGFLIFGYIWGVYVRHGDGKTAQWEIRALFYVVILYFLTIHLVKTPRHWKIISWMFPLGISLMGLITIERFFVLKALPGDAVKTYEDSLNGFNHESVLLFVFLIIWCLTKLMFWGNHVEKWLAFFLISPALICMVISNRRVAFACLAGCGLIILAVMYIRNRRLFLVTVIVLAIVMPPYVVIFRNASGPLGAAARAFSSSSAQPGSRDYNSDLYRVVEKNNVQLTIKQGPFTGIGFGQPFIRFISFIDLDGFTLQNFTAHVQVLWLWLKIGMGGWATFWFIICSAMFKLGQVIKYQPLDNQATVAILAGCILASIMIYSYLDLGLINTRLMTLLGAAIGWLELSYRNLKPLSVTEAIVVNSKKHALFTREKVSIK